MISISINQFTGLKLNLNEEEETDSNSSLENSKPSVEAASSEAKEIPARPLRKIKAFHDQELLQQQVNDSCLYILGIINFLLGQGR